MNETATVEPDNLSDMRTPSGIHTIDLMDERVAKIGPLSLGTVCDIEDKYGSFDAWQKKAMSLGAEGGGKIRDVVSMLWFLLINKKDFEDESDFLNAFPITSVDKLQGILGDVLAKSMPEAAKDTGKKAKATRKTKSTGGNTSARS